MFPALVTFSLLVPLFWKFIKSAADPAPLLGALMPIYVPPLAALFPLAIALPRLNSDCVAELVGAPLRLSAWPLAFVCSKPVAANVETPASEPVLVIPVLPLSKPVVLLVMPATVSAPALVTLKAAE